MKTGSMKLASSQSSPSSVPPAPPRFVIASRFGAFRDTVTIPDPFGAGASFTIMRAGCNAHRDWSRERADNDPMAIAAASAMMAGNGSAAAPLTKDETETVDRYRANQDKDDTAKYLIPIIDRLSLASVESNTQQSVVSALLASGKIRTSDVFRKQEDDQLAESAFLLRSWADMPGLDERDGQVEEVSIPFVRDSALALLTNDTPLDSTIDGVSALLKSNPCWMSEQMQFGLADKIPAGYQIYDQPAPKDKAVGKNEAYPLTAVAENPFALAADDHRVYVWMENLPIANLTLGRAYQLWIIATSADRSLFRDQVMEAAAKNSQPSSGSINTSEGGESNADHPISSPTSSTDS